MITKQQADELLGRISAAENAVEDMPLEGPDDEQDLLRQLAEALSDAYRLARRVHEKAGS